MCAHYSNQAQLLQLFSALTHTLTHLHKYKYILMLILFQKISQPKLHSTRLDSFVPIPDCLSVSIISHSASRSACIFSLLMPHGCRCRHHRSTHKPSRASQADSGPDRALNWTASSLFLSLPLPSLRDSLSLSCCLALLGSRICWLGFLSRVATTLRWSWTQTLTSSSSLLST